LQSQTKQQPQYSQQYSADGYGLPLKIVSDGGKEFCNEVVNEMLKLMSIKKTTTYLYHPQRSATKQ
jgi:hypothetical protein